MNKTINLYYRDLRYLFRHSFYITTLILFFIAMTFVFLFHLNLGPIDMLDISEHYLSPFTTCFAMILTIRLYRASESWIKIYPFSLVWVLLSKWFSAMTFMLLFTFIKLALFLFSAHHWGFDGPSFWHVLFHLSLSSLLIYALAISAGLFIASMIRDNIAYIVGFLVTLFCSFLFPIIFSDGLFDRLPWSEVLLNEKQIDIWWLFATLALFLFIFTMFITFVKTPTKRLPATALSLIIAIGLLGSSLITYYNYWSKHWKDFRSHQAVAVSATHSDNHFQTPFTVKDMQMDIFDGNSMWTVNCKLNVTMPKNPPSSKLVSFTINPDFTVEQVTINGQIIDYTQHGGWIDLPANDLDFNRKEETITFIYSGLLDEKAGSETWYGFTKASAFYAPANLAWYPIPGRVPLYIKEPNNSYVPKIKNTLTSEPITYTLRLHHFDTAVFSTAMEKAKTDHNVLVIEAKTNAGLTLFSGDFETWKSKNVSVIMPSYYESIRRSVTSEISALHDFLQVTFNRPIDGKLIFLPVDKGLLDNVPGSSHALLFSSLQLDKHEKLEDMEKTMIDYFLTGGRLLDVTQSKVAGNMNALYIQAIESLYQHEHHKTNISFKNKTSPFAIEVTKAIESGQIKPLKGFLRALIENQRNPLHPVITGEDWQLTWESFFS